MPLKLTVMAPKINLIQHLHDGTNTHMVITGPIGEQWDPDVAAVVFTVVVSQVIGDTPNPKVAIAIGWSQEYTTNGGGDWSATTRALTPNALEEGDATVAAWATIAMKDGGSETYEWTLPVKIVA